MKPEWFSLRSCKGEHIHMTFFPWKHQYQCEKNNGQSCSSSSSRVIRKVLSYNSHSSKVELQLKQQHQAPPRANNPNRWFNTSESHLLSAQRSVVLWQPPFLIWSFRCSNTHWLNQKGLALQCPLLIFHLTQLKDQKIGQTIHLKHVFLKLFILKV